jgi:hypothetical protein
MLPKAMRGTSMMKMNTARWNGSIIAGQWIVGAHAQVQGVDSLLRGKFWVASYDSATESDSDEVDQLSCSLHKMSISSPAKPRWAWPSSTVAFSDFYSV